MWYTCIINNLQPGQNYRRAGIVDIMKRERRGLSENSYVWAIGSLVKKGLLQHEGRNCYSLPNGKKKGVYIPLYSEEAMTIWDQIDKKYPLKTSS